MFNFSDSGIPIYLVGGAVRDTLMGILPGDRDWVVVGAQAQDLIAQGYRPVGRDFPVFLHPQTKEEVALARTERKTAPGYHGFVFHADPTVTLEEDLARRDLTINAMAQGADGRIVDPFHGQDDLARRVLRHVGPAFEEDPVRILRLARFAARWPQFTVAPETLDLCRRMVAAGEVSALVAERVWQELARGLMEAQPSRMLQVLRDCGALAVLLPEVDRLYGVPQSPLHHPEIDTGRHVELVIDMAARLAAPLEVRFAALTHDLGKGVTPQALWPRHLGHEERSVEWLRTLSARWRVPVDCRDLAVLVAREHGHIHRSEGLGAEALVRLLGRCDAWRRPARFDQILQACECDARGRAGKADDVYPQRARLNAALTAAQRVDVGAVALAVQTRLRRPLSELDNRQSAGSHGAVIASAIDVARAQAILAAL